MTTHTYYDVLGVSRDATLEEITTAKNALAKVYHPDANIHKDIDTTAFMQEILEAYRVLSNPEKRKEYNREIFGETTRVFRTFTVGPEDGRDESGSFVTYWNTANRLNEIIGKSVSLIRRESQKKSLPQRIFKKIGKSPKQEESFRNRQISELSMQAVQYIAVLKMAGIPMEYWNPDAMNWVLVRWGQKQSIDYHTLFPRYDAYIEETKSSSEKLRLRNQNRQYQNNLKRLLSYALM
ncbi:J domain-containing protein [Clostridium sp. Marseille-P3244]|uniref:J domain-containing protein n=1 Tax=Clostridium sp. Marseille-P3244 TaxID=1871020 RepID=UPI0009305C2F|nr:DnaJ domain-containing protein [Clostridium sp. Marseille-P3244]